jgi:SAM-dependent methyltransferase
VQRVAIEQFARLERDHWWFRGRRAVYLGLLRKHLGPRRPRRVLDLGSGVGGFLAGLAELGELVAPADVDAESLGYSARREFPPNVARPLLAGACALPFASESFDLVCLFDVLEHLDDDRAAMREVARVLAPNGLAIASVPAHAWLYANNDRVAGHRRRYSRGTLAKVFTSAGLRVERNTHANALLFAAIAPAILCAKAWESLAARDRDAQHTNLSWPLPRPLHSLFYAAFAAELPLSSRVDLPLGHSILAIARK